MTRARVELVDRRRTGWALGRLAFGGERRNYRITLKVTLAWPSLWWRREPRPLAPALVVDEQALAARAAIDRP